jgi:hypothetical protein
MKGNKDVEIGRRQTCSGNRRNPNAEIKEIKEASAISSFWCNTEIKMQKWNGNQSSHYAKSSNALPDSGLFLAPGCG